MDLDQFDCLNIDCYGTLIDWETGLLSVFQPILKNQRISVEVKTLLELFGKAEPDLTVPDLRSLAILAGTME